MFFVLGIYFVEPKARKSTVLTKLLEDGWTDNHEGHTVAFCMALGNATVWYQSSRHNDDNNMCRIKVLLADFGIYISTYAAQY